MHASERGKAGAAMRTSADLAAWLTPGQVAQALSLSLSSVRSMIRDGRLPARRLRGSRLLRIARGDLESLLEPIPANGIRQQDTVGVVR